MEIHECEGCRSYKNPDICEAMMLLPKLIENISFCPCSNCLIKPMCGDPCTIFLSKVRKDTFARITYRGETTHG